MLRVFVCVGVCVCVGVVFWCLCPSSCLTCSCLVGVCVLVLFV